MAVKIGEDYKINTSPEIAIRIFKETENEYIVIYYLKNGDSYGAFEKKALKRMISKGIIQKISPEEAVMFVLCQYYVSILNR